MELDMADQTNISINLSTDDLVKLIEATAKANPVPGGVQPLNPQGVGATGNAGGGIQPLWCGVLQCGGSVG